VGSGGRGSCLEAGRGQVSGQGLDLRCLLKGIEVGSRSSSNSVDLGRQLLSVELLPTSAAIRRGLKSSPTPASQCRYLNNSSL